jgi:hypothetical protein
VLSAGELPSFERSARSALDKVFGAYGERSWTGLSIHSRVMAVEHLWDPVEGGRELLHFYRRLVHRESNQILHLSAFSMGGQVRGRTSTALSLALGPSDVYVGRALIAAFYSFGQLISLMRDTFAFSDANGWRKVYGDPLAQIELAVEDT